MTTSRDELLREARNRIDMLTEAPPMRMQIDVDLLSRIDAALAAPTVEGKWVPVEPTGEMILAGLRMVDVVGQYKAMLAAAPKDKP